MDIQTNYGICKNVDYEHMVEYLGGLQPDTACFSFTDFILSVNENVYLLFGYEVWRDKDDEFHFFVEEGFENGEAQTYKAEISKADQEYIKKLYYEYLKKHTKNGTKYIVTKMGLDGGIYATDCLGNHGRDLVSNFSDNVDVFERVEDAKDAGFGYFGRNRFSKWCVCEYDPESKIVTGKCHYINK